MSDELSFGMIAKNRRRDLGLTQEELARRVGCAPITVRKIEADDLRPSVQIAERLAMALNVPLEERSDFVRLARTERPVFDEASVTPMPAPEEIGSEDLSGRAIRGYALGERLGNGGMGVVYRAVQPLVEREVAIKIIMPMYANHPDFIRRFEAEAQLVARLEHPHVVPLYDYWREPGVAYLIMRLLRGGSVQSLLRGGTVLSSETILRMMEQIGSALSASHRAGVVHRDLKPANVLLDDDFNAYLADFGIAKNLSSPTSETQANAVIGSLDYISPEQIRSEFVRPQTDIYALGVMLYELLTGRVPFRGNTPFDVMSQHLNTPLPALAENRSGLPRVLDDVIKHATAKDPLERYENVELMLMDLRNALGATPQEVRVRAGSQQKTVPPLTEIDNPYKGLRAFGEGDAQDFYGRETLTQQLLVRLGETGELSRFLAVVGPSGSGKSSVVKAGLIPALRRGALPGSEHWFIVEMMPGAHPLEELEAALLRVAVNPPSSLLEQFQKDSRGLIRAVRRSIPNDPNIELVLVIDQFEEVFTLVQDEAERMRFLGLLVTAIMDETSRVRVIFTMRADFVDRPLGYVDFGELLRQRMEVILPLTPDELDSAIASPSERVGLQLESGLVAAILRDLGDQPGTLPMLQYALTELYEKRAGRVLTRSAYQEIGGVLGALGRRAEEVYKQLDEESQGVARQVFLRLVTLGEGVEDTRRRALIAELENLKPGEVDPRKFSISLKTALDAFGNARLLSFDRDPGTRGPTVEVAHEAILREWPRLREWLDESRTLVRMQRQLALAVSEWRNAGHDEGFLLSGAKLAQYEGWTAGSAVALTQQEIDFLKASLTARDQKEMEEAERQKRELETVRKLAETERTSVSRLRGRNRVISVVGVIALVLAVFAGLFAFKSNQNAQRAEQQTKLSTSRELAASAIGNLDIDPELSILLALQGLSVQHTAEAENALRRSLATSRVKWNLESEATVSSVAFSPDGQHLVTAGYDGLAKVWDIKTGKEVLSMDASWSITYVTYTPDGTQIITSDDRGYIHTWDAVTGKLFSSIMAYNNGIATMALSPDGQHMAVVGSVTSMNSQDETIGSYEIGIWDIKTGEKVDSLPGHITQVTSIAFTRDGARLASASYDGNVMIWDASSGKRLITFKINESIDGYLTLLFNADGTRLITSDVLGDIFFWDVTTNSPKEIFYRKVRAGGGFVALSLSRDGKLLAVGDNNNISIWDAEFGYDLFVLPMEQQTVGSGFSPDGNYFASGGYGTSIKIWDLSSPGEKLALTAHDGKRVGDVAYSPDGSLLLTESSWTNSLSIWDSSNGKELKSIPVSGICCSVEFNPDGTQLINGSNNGWTTIFDLKTGKAIRTLYAGDSSIFVIKAIFNPSGKYIGTANDDGTAKIWDAANGKNILTMTVDTGSVNDIAFSPDGNLLATASTDGSYPVGQVIVWDAASGKQLFFLGYDPNSPVPWCLAFSPDGSQLAVGYDDHTVRIWDVSAMKLQTQPLFILRGHSNFVNDVAFSPDGTRLATAGFDGLVKLWDTSSGSEISTFPGHTAEVSGIAFSPDGKYLASVSLYGALRVYYTQIEDLIAAAKQRVTRSLTTEECQKYLHMDVCPATP